MINKFKVGDLVRVADGGQHYSTYAEWVEKNAPDALQEWRAGRHYDGVRYTVHNLEGRVVVAAPHGYNGKMLYLVRATDNSLFVISEDGLELVRRRPDTAKVVITTDGKTTLARLYEGRKVIRSAEAQCHPSDAFNFALGARLAFDRLMEARKSSNIDWPAFLRGEVLVEVADNEESKKVFLAEVERNCPQLIWLSGHKPTAYVPSGDQHFHTHKGFLRCSSGRDFSGQENIKQRVAYEPTPKAEPEPIKLYCVKDYMPGEFLTKGKVYELKGTLEKGTLIYDDGWKDRFYRHYADHFGKNGPLKDYLVPLVKRQAEPGEWVYVLEDNGGRVEAGTIWQMTHSDTSGHLFCVGGWWVNAGNYLVLDGYKGAGGSNESSADADADN